MSRNALWMIFFCVGYVGILGAAQSPLYVAICQKNLVALKNLLGQGVAINAKDGQGNTPLYKAVQFGNLAMVVQLLRAGANVNAKNNDECTPLHRAALAGNYKIVFALLVAGANCNEKNKLGDTPLHFAAKLFKGIELSKEYSINSLESWDNGATTVIENDKNALKKNAAAKLRCVKLLLACGANIHIKNNSHESAADIAMTTVIGEAIRQNGRGVKAKPKFNFMLSGEYWPYCCGVAGFVLGVAGTLGMLKFRLHVLSSWVLRFRQIFHRSNILGFKRNLVTFVPCFTQVS